jgi:hypothetical protein
MRALAGLGHRIARNTGEDDASELEGERAREARQNSFRVPTSLLARYCSDEEYDSSRVTVVNK